MESSMLQEVNDVLLEYDLTVLGIKTESYKEKKGVWWVRTPDGFRILKKQSQSASMLDFIIGAVEHLQSNGIYLPKIIKTRSGANYAIINDTCYVLSEAIDGKALDYGSTENIRRIVQELARFHKASRGFVPPVNAKVRTHLGDWVEEYAEKMNKLKGYYDRELAQDEHTAFGKIVLDEFPYFYHRMETAIHELDQSAYHQYVEQAQAEGALCHQDFTAGNLLVDHADHLYVLDIDSMTMDIPLRDIRKILNKIMKRYGGWRENLVIEILQGYQEVNPLDASQWGILKPMLIYPHLFEGIMSKYYERREKTWTEEKYLKRLQEMILMDKSVEPIIDHFEQIRPM